jgi:hypothetical protein
MRYGMYKIEQVITSSSHNARSTFSSNVGSTKLGVPLCMVVNVSRRSVKDAALSRQGWDFGDFPEESVLERG